MQSALRIFEQNLLLRLLSDGHGGRRYKQGEDLELALHADASVVTLNVCIGRRGPSGNGTAAGFSGGALAFEDYVEWPAADRKRTADDPPRDTVPSLNRCCCVLTRR